MRGFFLVLLSAAAALDTAGLGFDFWELYEPSTAWKMLAETLGSLAEVKNYVERLAGPYEELQEAEDSRRALSPDVKKALEDAAAAMMAAADGLVVAGAELEQKDARVMRARIERAVAVADWETEGIKKVFQPKTLREAMIVRLNDMLLVATTGEALEEAKQRLKTAVQRSLEAAKQNIGALSRAIPRNRNAEEIRKDAVNKLDSIRILPAEYRQVAADKIRALKGLASADAA